MGDIETVTDQSRVALKALMDYSMIGTDSKVGAIYTNVGSSTESGGRAVYRHTGTTALQGPLGTRGSKDLYADATYIRTWMTAIYNPDMELANQLVESEELLMKQEVKYKQYLNSTAKLYEKFARQNILDLFELFNFQFSAPTAYPNPLFFAKGTQGLDGNFTALNERLISTQHARADGGTTISNAVNTSGNAAPFSVTAYNAALEQGGALVDDVGEPMPLFGGLKDIFIVNQNGQVATVKTLNESQWQPKTGNNDINVYQGSFERIVTSPYFGTSYYTPSVTNSTAWTVLDRSNLDPEVGTGLVRVEFQPMDARVDRVPEKDSIAFKMKEEYAYGWLDFRNFIGSNGSGLTYSS
jgi:hypothetical protein